MVIVLDLLIFSQMDKEEKQLNLNDYDLVAYCDWPTLTLVATRFIIGQGHGSSRQHRSPGVRDLVNGFTPFILVLNHQIYYDLTRNELATSSTTWKGIASCCTTHLLTQTDRHRQTDQRRRTTDRPLRGKQKRINSSLLLPTWINGAGIQTTYNFR